MKVRKVDIGLERQLQTKYMLRWCSGLILARYEQEGNSCKPVKLSTRVRIPAGALPSSEGLVAQHGRASGFYLNGRNQSVAGSNPVGPTFTLKDSKEIAKRASPTAFEASQNLSSGKLRESEPSQNQSDIPGVPITSSVMANELIGRDLKKVDRLWRC